MESQEKPAPRQKKYERKGKSDLVGEDAAQRVNAQNLREKEAAEALAKKNYNFLQVEIKTLKEFRRLADQSPKALKLLFTLAEKMNRQNGIMASNATLSQIAGMSIPTVTRAIKLLKDERWIQVIRIGTANAYVINSTVFWKSTGDQKHASFHAQIIATSTEQTDPVESWDGVTLKHFPFLDHDPTADITVAPQEKVPLIDREKLALEAAGQQRLIE